MIRETDEPGLSGHGMTFTIGRGTEVVVAARRASSTWRPRRWSTRVLVIAVVAMFAFFTLLGAFCPGQAVLLTVVIAALAVLWVAHAIWASRHSDRRDPSARRARERRGF